jgi:hypothetical protein
MSIEVDDKTGTEYRKLGSQESWKSEQPNAKVIEGKYITGNRTWLYCLLRLQR